MLSLSVVLFEIFYHIFNNELAPYSKITIIILIQWILEIKKKYKIYTLNDVKFQLDFLIHSDQTNTIPTKKIHS